MLLSYFHWKKANIFMKFTVKCATHLSFAPINLQIITVANQTYWLFQWSICFWLFCWKYVNICFKQWFPSFIYLHTILQFVQSLYHLHLNCRTHK